MRAQALDADRPSGVVEAVRRVGVLPIDPVAPIAPAADLVLWSRLGTAYDHADLERAAEGRELLEIGGAVRPAEQIALFLAEMAAFPDVFGPDFGPTFRDGIEEWVVANDSFRRDLVRELAADGPLRTQSLPDTSVVPWRSSGWTNAKNVRQMLELLARKGQVAIAERRGRDVFWDLPERVYPDVPAVPLAEAARQRVEGRLATLGIVRAKTVMRPAEPLIEDDEPVGVTAEIVGVGGTWRVDPGQLDRLGERFRGRTALLCPVDRLVFDRERMADLFEFDYVVEMYKPAGQRRWGYYALPILDGDQLIGKVDATADRKGGELRVEAIHEDEPFSAAERRRVHAELADLATWLDLPLRLPS